MTFLQSASPRLSTARIGRSAQEYPRRRPAWLSSRSSVTRRAEIDAHRDLQRRRLNLEVLGERGAGHRLEIELQPHILAEHHAVDGERGAGRSHLRIDADRLAISTGHGDQLRIFGLPG